LQSDRPTTEAEIVCSRAIVSAGQNRPRYPVAQVDHSVRPTTLLEISERRAAGKTVAMYVSHDSKTHRGSRLAETHLFQKNGRGCWRCRLQGPRAAHLGHRGLGLRRL